MSRISAVVCVCLGLAIVVGCGGGPQNSTSSSTSGTSAQASMTWSATIPVTGGADVADVPSNLPLTIQLTGNQAPYSANFSFGGVMPNLSCTSCVTPDSTGQWEIEVLGSVLVNNTTCTVMVGSTVASGSMPAVVELYVPQQNNDGPDSENACATWEGTAAWTTSN